MTDRLKRLALPIAIALALAALAATAWLQAPEPDAELCDARYGWDRPGVVACQIGAPTPGPRK